MRFCRLLLVFALAWICTGCAEVKETWRIEHDGSGTLRLAVSWHGALWRQVRAALGDDVLRLGARDVPPLHEAGLRDSLRGLPGLSVERLKSDSTSRGWRRVTLDLRFDDLNALTRWELFCRRTLVLEGPAGDAREAHRTATMRMDPFAYIPVIDDWMRLERFIDTQEDATSPQVRRRVVEVAARLGLDMDRVPRVLQLLRPHQQDLRFACAVHMPGSVVDVRGAATREDTKSVSLALDAEAIRAPRRDRSLHATWHVSSLDTVSSLSQRGDAVRGTARLLAPP